MPNRNELKEGEYICPETGRIKDLESCESSCMGHGCKYKLSCQPYITQKEKQKELPK